MYGQYVLPYLDIAVADKLKWHTFQGPSCHQSCRALWQQH